MRQERQNYSTDKSEVMVESRRIIWHLGSRMITALETATNKQNGDNP
jgi:hypothetical protein